ncbi:MAG: CDP-alcohol phosphatidyltransferase family protein [Deltaproteobacteria bacterium]|nr:CDP-alcohol phosphatidyltransferase family protein [Deltaproteobacteria bacterium]
MNLRKTFFILPNLFTLANIFCGFVALALSAGATEFSDLYQAALAICFGFFFDLFDGRVARLTRTQSELGMQLDSLADVITFGAAPAMLVYKWGLTKFGLWGIFVAFLFLAAGALRLARFNVLTYREHMQKAAAEADPSKEPEKAAPQAYFLGLSIPAAAAMIVSLVVVHAKVGGKFIVYSQSAIAALVVILSYLMISRVRFRSFKNVRVTRRTVAVAFLLLAASVIITTRLRASFVFVFLMSAYLALGLTEEVVRYAADQRRLRRERKLAAGEPLLDEDHDPEDDDAAVLRELGGDETDQPTK